MQIYTDYLMTISLPYSIVKEVNRYKRSSVNAIGHFEGMYKTPNIMISHQTHCKHFLTDTAIEKMKDRLALMPPIELQIIGFDFFKETPFCYTIYAVIEKNIETENWFNQLITEMEFKVQHFVPMILIAKKLEADQFKTLWPLFAVQEFEGSFTVNSLTILQKETFTENSHWRVYRELFFGTRQLAF